MGANSTDSVRGCLMNCVTPAFMLPLMDQSGPTSAFLDSDLSADVRLTFSLLVRLFVQRATLTLCCGRS